MFASTSLTRLPITHLFTTTHYLESSECWVLAEGFEDGAMTRRILASFDAKRGADLRSSGRRQDGGERGCVLGQPRDCALE